MRTLHSSNIWLQLCRLHRAINKKRARFLRIRPGLFNYKHSQQASHHLQQRVAQSGRSAAAKAVAPHSSGSPTTDDDLLPAERDPSSAAAALAAGGGPPPAKDRRRELHTQAEQKRRDAIKHGYDKLYELVGGGATAPSGGAATQADSGAKALSKASILQRSIRHMEHLARQREAQETELDRLRKEVMALKIMKMNYDHLVSRNAANAQPQMPQPQPLPDDVKFGVFQAVMDRLFLSFDRSTSAASFAELSGCVITWLEEQCRPQTLHELSMQALQQELARQQQQQHGRQTRLA